MSAQEAARFPRLRGDEPGTSHAGQAERVVFPAYAGMSLEACAVIGLGSRFPRLRGDEPISRKFPDATDAFSPPTRG